MSRQRDAARRLAQRQRLLEIEAEVQRVTLNATFASWRDRRLLAWGAVVGGGAMRLLAEPRVRWMLGATALAWLRRRFVRR